MKCKSKWVGSLEGGGGDGDVCGVFGSIRSGQALLF